MVLQISPPTTNWHRLARGNSPQYFDLTWFLNNRQKKSKRTRVAEDTPEVGQSYRLQAYVSGVWTDPKFNPKSMAASITPLGIALDFETVE